MFLSGDSEKRALCAEMFGDPSGVLPEMLARKELGGVFSRTIKMRNDWIGHGGIVSQSEAHSRNELLLTELQKTCEAMGDGWDKAQLVRAIQGKPGPNAFENEVAVLVGSNSEFLKEVRSMSIFLQADRLYLASRDSREALLLIPLVRVEHSPASAKNSCYFFNRIGKDGARFVSYHFEDRPEWIDQSDAIRFLSESFRPMTIG